MGAPGKMEISTWEELLDLWRELEGIRSSADLELRLSSAAERKSILSQRLGAICVQFPGLARRLPGIWNLVTAPRTCGCGSVGTDGGYFMKTGTTLVTTIFALATFPLLAQQPPPASQPSRPAPQPTPRGPAPAPPNSPAASPEAPAVEMSPVNGELLSKLDSKTAKTGDSVVVQTKSSVKTADGTEIPKGSKLVGHVMGVHPSGAGENSQVALQFDHFELKGGQRLAVHSQIQSIAPAGGAASTSGSGAMSGPPASGSSNPSTNGTNGGSSANGAPQGTGGDPGAAAGSAAPAAGTVVARTANIAIRTTWVPGVLLANNAPGQQDPRMAQASSILLGAKQDIQLDNGTQMVLGVSAAGGGTQ